MIEAINDTELKCPGCDNRLTDAANFCGTCGRELTPINAKQTDVFEILAPTLIYYFITLILLSAYKFTSIFPEGIEGIILVTIIDVAIVTAFWLYAGTVNVLFSLKNFKYKILALTIAGASVSAGIVSTVADWINVSILENGYYSPYLFQDTNFPFAWTVVFTCVVPALFEEVAFRGFMFSNVADVTSSKGAVYVTSFVFGIIHLGFINLLWLVPMGVIFSLMRLKYNTLWYGIFGHFTYNFCIVLIDFYQVNGL